MIQHHLSFRRDGDRPIKNPPWGTRIGRVLATTLQRFHIRKYGWEVASRVDHNPTHDDAGWHWRSEITFTNPTHDASGWEIVLRELTTNAITEGIEIADPNVSTSETVSEVRLFLPSTAIQVPTALLTGDDTEVETHPLVAGYYGRAAQLRLLFGAIETAVASDFRVTPHLLLDGPPGGGKSHALRLLKSFLGPDGFLEIDGPTTTRAGLEQIFLKTTNHPPVLIIEEIDRADSGVYEVLLAITDDRREVRKTVHRMQTAREVVTLVIAAANDRIVFDRRLGGTPENPGRLSSRFQKIYFPQPGAAELGRILTREARHYPDFKIEWVDACLELMRVRGETDPRKAIRWLSGRDRLLDGQYQRDLAASEPKHLTETKPRFLFTLHDTRENGDS